MYIVLHLYSLYCKILCPNTWAQSAYHRKSKSFNILLHISRDESVASPGGGAARFLVVNDGADDDRGGDDDGLDKALESGSDADPAPWLLMSASTLPAVAPSDISAVD